MFIYNETTKPFSIEKGKDIGVIFRKVTKQQKDDNYKTIKTKKMHVLAHKTVLDEIDIEEKINNAVSTDEPVKVINKDSVVYFSKKDLSPFLTTLGKGKAMTLLVSINLLQGNKKIVSIDNPNIFILKGYIMAGELSLVASFVDQSKDLTISMLEGQDLVRYKFTYIEDEIILIKERSLNSTGITAPVGFKIKTYIPTQVTSAIVCYNKDKESLESLLSKEDREKHVIVDINNKTLEEELIKLKQDNYGAVTLFVDRNELDDETYKIYRKAITLCQKHLRIVMVLFKNNKIKKIKY